jgi:hypothetical protein
VVAVEEKVEKLLHQQEQKLEQPTVTIESGVEANPRKEVMSNAFLKALLPPLPPPPHRLVRPKGV